MLNPSAQIVSSSNKQTCNLLAREKQARKKSPEQVTHLKIARSLRFLEKNWQRPINVADLFQSARMSRRGFVKAFTKHVGSNPSDELERLRMEHARQLILRPGHSLKQTSASCGYRSINSFLVAFRRFNGMNPSQYVRRNSSCRLITSAEDAHTGRRRGNRRRHLANAFFKVSIRKQRS